MGPDLTANGMDTGNKVTEVKRLRRTRRIEMEWILLLWFDLKKAENECGHLRKRSTKTTMQLRYSSF